MGAEQGLCLYAAPQRLPAPAHPYVAAQCCRPHLLILFGSAVSGWTYLISFFFSSPSAAQIFIIFLVFILGLILSIVGVVLRLISTTTQPYVDYIRYIFALFPPFAFGEALENMTLINVLSLNELPRGQTYKPMDWKIAGLGMAFLAWETVVFLGATIAYEYIKELPCTQQQQVALPALQTNDTRCDGTAWRLPIPSLTSTLPSHCIHSSSPFPTGAAACATRTCWRRRSASSPAPPTTPPSSSSRT